MLGLYLQILTEFMITLSLHYKQHKLLKTKLIYLIYKYTVRTAL